MVTRFGQMGRTVVAPLELIQSMLELLAHVRGEADPVGGKTLLRDITQVHIQAITHITHIAFILIDPDAQASPGSRDFSIQLLGGANESGQSLVHEL